MVKDINKICCRNKIYIKYIIEIIINVSLKFKDDI